MSENPTLTGLDGGSEGQTAPDPQLTCPVCGSKRVVFDATSSLSCPDCGYLDIGTFT